MGRERQRTKKDIKQQREKEREKERARVTLGTCSELIAVACCYRHVQSLSEVPQFSLDFEHVTVVAYMSAQREGAAWPTASLVHTSPPAMVQDSDTTSEAGL